jgi:uncharacterized protein
LNATQTKKGRISAMSLSRRFLLTLSAVSAAAFVSAAPVAFAQTTQPVPTSVQPESGIDVLGQGVVSTTPGAARVTLGVDISDASLATAQAQASQRMDAVINTLKSSGIADSDIRTTRVSVTPQYDNPQPGQAQVLRGYQIQNLVEARSTNVDTVGTLIDAAIGAGATRVQGISFEPGDLNAAQAQARDLALQDARAKAEQLAQASGLTLGRIVQIETSDVGGQPPVPLAQPAEAVQRATPIQPGELQIRSTVRVVWEIQTA